MKKPVVFSLVREQSVFMTAIMGLLTFLSVIALGVALAIGTGVMRWNAQWDLMATVQVVNPDNIAATQKTIDDNREKIANVNELSQDKMMELMRPWISSTDSSLKNFLPKMYELKFKTKDDLKSVGAELARNARFLTHAEALRGATDAGWRMMLIAGLVMLLAIGAISVCISYIARNTAMLHRRELEILNQVGASDAYVAKQMQIIVGRITMIAAAAGFVVAMPMLWLILGAAHASRVGLMAMMTLGVGAWIILILLPVLITVFAIFITRRTTLKILKDN